MGLSSNNRFMYCLLKSFRFVARDVRSKPEIVVIPHSSYDVMKVDAHTVGLRPCGKLLRGRHIGVIVFTVNPAASWQMLTQLRKFRRVLSKKFDYTVDSGFYLPPGDHQC